MSIRKQNVKRSVYRNGANIGNLSALIFMFALLILWQLGAMKVDAAYILPTPVQILQKLWELREPLFTVHLPATMLVTGYRTSDISWSWSFACCRYGCKPDNAEVHLSRCRGLADDTNDGDCASFRAVVRLWYMEQGAGNGAYHIFPNYDYCV